MADDTKAAALKGGLVGALVGFGGMLFFDFAAPVALGLIAVGAAGSAISSRFFRKS